MAFGYVPDYKGKSPLKDLYVRTIGYPYPPRRNEAAIVLGFLNPKKGEKILDIGCGDGVWYNELKKRGINVTGIDLSEHDINKLGERAKKMGITHHVIKANAQKMPIESNSFDKALSISTLEHIKDDKRVFEETSRVLKTGGTLVVSLPLNKVPLLTKIAVRFPNAIKKTVYNNLVLNSSDGNGYLNNYSKYYFHYRNYDEKSLKEMVEKCGFKIEKKSYNCKFFGQIPWSLYHTLKIFQREKSKKTDYSFKNETVFALTFPVFYPLFLLDRLLFWKDGQIIILRLKKK